PIDAAPYSLIYAGAQKNAGPAGGVMVILREEMLRLDAAAPAELPILLQYPTPPEHRSLFNTPPAVAIYVLHPVPRGLRRNGGLAAMEKHNRDKAALIYQAIDAAPGFYRGHAEPDSRSLMNITFRLPSEALEAAFVKQSQAAGMDGLKGHRSV